MKIMKDEKMQKNDKLQYVENKTTHPGKLTNQINPNSNCEAKLKQTRYIIT